MKAANWLLGWLLWSGGGTGGPTPAGEQEPLYFHWDRLFVKPELPLQAVQEEGKVTLLLYHTYPSSLHHLRLSGRNQAFEVTAEPPEVEELEPTTIVPVTLHLRRRGRVPGDKATVSVEFSADEMSRGRTLGLTVPLTPQGEATVNQELSLPVGQVVVVVTRMGRVAYALQMGAALFLLAWLGWRRWRFGR